MHYRKTSKQERVSIKQETNIPRNRNIPTLYYEACS